MPSRIPPSPSHAPPPPATATAGHHLIPPIAVAAASFSLLLLLAFLYRKLTLSRTTPIPHSPDTDTCPKLRRFRFSVLRKATSSFSPSQRLGQGGFGSVYKASLPSTGQVFAVKLMDSAGSLQAEREFHNELSLAHRLISAAGSPSSPFLVSILGYSSSSSSKLQRKLLVYELMSNGSLQDKLLDHKCAELSFWDKRFNIILDVARALHFLHYNCGPTPVVHGDIKPSNVLLDVHFHAKLGDFGLATILDEDLLNTKDDNNDKGVLLEVQNDVDVDDDNSKVVVSISKNNQDGEIDNGSTFEETESLATMTTPVEASPSEVFERASSLPDSCISVDAETGGGITPYNTTVVSNNKKKKNGGSGRDYWWWKQDHGAGNGCGSESGRVKDYVMEWIGSEINKERPTSCDLAARSRCATSNNDHDTKSHSIGVRVDGGSPAEKTHKKHQKKKRWDWWTSWDEDTWWRKRDKIRKPREWWKEEFCEELTKKNTNHKKKKKQQLIGAKSSSATELWWQRDEDFIAPERKKRRRKSKTSFGSIDWWLDGLSGERRNSQDWAGNDIPKSGGISSTPSMRGTVCYIAPEYGGGAQLSEKCDVYSFGVLVLVIVAGRRPLQVTASPMSEFERANLVSWARQLAYNAKLLDLVDSSIQSLDREQALLCITIALLCIQRSPSKRPNMKDIVHMLTGDSDPPPLPFEFSPSPPSNFPFKSRSKPR